MFATCSGWLIGQGGSTALDTLASVAFTGGINKYQPGILLQRSFVVLTLFFIPICIIWFYSEPIFLVLGQDKQLSHDSAKFLTYLIPGGFGYIYFELMKKYLQSQGIIRPSTYVMLIVSPLNGLFNYLFINGFNVGLMGAPIATGICYWIAFILLTLYTGFVQGHECWGGWNRSCLKNLDAFSRIAALGIIQLGTEFWAFEIIALVAGRLGSLPLAGQSVLMTADQVIVTIPFGIGVATSFRVGNVLGSQDAAAARRVARTSVTLSVAVAGLILSVLVIGRNHLGKLFTTDPEVVQYVAGVLPWVGLFQLADALNGSCGGILRGMGKQRIGAAANLISYYVVALPLGSHMAFRGLELSGLWIGQCIGMGLVGMLELLFVLWTDWEQEVTRALDRIKEDEDEPGSQQDLLT
ncbi:hypothetical protein CkaCkLH20_08670 [Colletotrichum karsti]|uniref:MATE efflux family protein n=1 Tax=Colletotrichum karsti TaxID=1095194 RepID=A0A9P6I4N9_9PEZI|nr:uncharacterized protein CkaCkLH20_08670 [Colletotrichum karsti]KAF9873936.1 hypothetical protein CkaCkLH20_08670 [Colletotrichum karsti]